MAEKAAVEPVKLLGMQDDMYPRFNFLKQRLLSIHPRFKAVIEREKLDDLIQNGNQLKKDIERTQEKLKDTVGVYLIGCHRTISKKSMNTVFIASSKYRDKEALTKKTLSPADFKDQIKNVDEYPCVIVHFVDTLQSLEEASRQLMAFLPEKAWKSCILCTGKCDKVYVLDDFRFSTDPSGDVSLEKLIQSCLEYKVVGVLRLMVDFIQKHVFSPEAESNMLPGRLSLKVAVLQSLKTAVSEPNLRQDINGMKHNI